MAIVQMQRMTVLGLRENRKRILERIQQWGLMQIDMELEDDRFQRMDTLAQRQQFDRKVQLLQQALDLLDRYAPEKKGLAGMLAGKLQISPAEYKDWIDNQSITMDDAHELLEKEKDIAQLRADIAKLEGQIESLTPWMQLDVALSAQGTRQTRILNGTLPGPWTPESLQAQLAQMEGQLEAYEVSVLWMDRDSTYLSVLCLRQQAQQLEENLRSIGFARPTVTCDQTPLQASQRMARSIEKKQVKMEQLELELSHSGSLRKQMQVTADYYRTRAQKYEVLGQLPQSRSTFLISGYAPQTQAQAMAKELEQQYEAAVELEQPDPEADVPVMLKNNAFGSITEGILESFGLPGKGEIDPSFITACFYVFLFGLMLSDAAYGLIVSLACGFCLLKFRYMERNMQKSLQLFFWCGVSTLFWGIMFGGYFGDAVNVISRVFFGHEVEIKAAWFVPLNDPTKLLVYSMLFGLIHLFTGLGIKGYLCLKKKDIQAFLFDVLCWFFLLVGLMIMLLPTDLFYGISQMEFHFSAGVVLAGKILAIVGAGGILLMSARDKKNFGLRIALGAYDLYNITGWLSDILSYSRLLALGLATGVIAQVVNQMGSMAGNNVFGIILFVVVFIVGHIMNLGINLLGAYVHTCRLQYVEFFGKFYEGTGRAFKPFKNERKYVEIREDTNK